MRLACLSPFTGGDVEVRSGLGSPRQKMKPNPLSKDGSLFEKPTGLLPRTLEWGRGNKEGHSETEWDPCRLLSYRPKALGLWAKSSAPATGGSNLLTCHSGLLSVSSNLYRLQGRIRHQCSHRARFCQPSEKQAKDRACLTLRERPAHWREDRFYIWMRVYLCTMTRFQVQV